MVIKKTITGIVSTPRYINRLIKVYMDKDDYKCANKVNSNEAILETQK